MANLERLSKLRIETHNHSGVSRRVRLKTGEAVLERMILLVLVLVVVLEIEK